ISAKSSPKRAFGKIRNQSLLEALLCLRRVVVPIARYFSSDSYAGSVISKSIDPVGKSRSQQTASAFDSSKDGNGKGSSTCDGVALILSAWLDVIWSTL